MFLNVQRPSLKGAIISLIKEEVKPLQDSRQQLAAPEILAPTSQLANRLALASLLACQRAALLACPAGLLARQPAQLAGLASQRAVTTA